MFNVASRRSFGVLAVIVAAGALLTGCNAQLENQNVAQINALRARVGVRQLARSAELNTKAQIQADRMAKAGRIFHSANLATGVSPGWRLIGENVAQAGSLTAAESALERSAPHYANLTRPTFSQVGVGVTVKNGQVFVVQEFVAR